jgi:uncharacterized glyoxalase superfamily protein PhnB
LTVSNAYAVISFYAQAFGATELARIPAPDENGLASANPILAAAGCICPSHSLGALW